VAGFAVAGGGTDAFDFQLVEARENGEHLLGLLGIAFAAVGGGKVGIDGGILRVEFAGRVEVGDRVVETILLKIQLAESDATRNIVGASADGALQSVARVGELRAGRLHAGAEHGFPVERQQHEVVLALVNTIARDAHRVGHLAFK
jgi:hypothetical protein